MVHARNSMRRRKSRHQGAMCVALTWLIFWTAHHLAVLHLLAAMLQSPLAQQQFYPSALHSQTSTVPSLHRLRLGEPTPVFVMTKSDFRNCSKKQTLHVASEAKPGQNFSTASQTWRPRSRSLTSSGEDWSLTNMAKPKKSPNFNVKMNDSVAHLPMRPPRCGTRSFKPKKKLLKPKSSFAATRTSFMPVKNEYAFEKKSPPQKSGQSSTCRWQSHCRWHSHSGHSIINGRGAPCSPVFSERCHYCRR